MLFALYDFLAYCLYSIQPVFRRKCVLCAAFLKNRLFSL